MKDIQSLAKDAAGLGTSASGLPLTIPETGSITIRELSPGPDWAGQDTGQILPGTLGDLLDGLSHDPESFYDLGYRVERLR